MGMDRVICGVDESERARHVVEVADRLAQRLDAELLLAHVAPAPRAITGPPITGAVRVPASVLDVDRAGQRADRLLRAARDWCSSSRVEQHVSFGDPAVELGVLAEASGDAVVVVGSRGHSPIAAAVLGSVSIRLAAISPVPVAVAPEARPGGQPPAGRPAIVCAVDGSAPAAAAAEVAGRLADLIGARLVLAHVEAAAPPLTPSAAAGRGESPLQQARLLIPPSVEVDLAVRRGDPVHEIDTLADTVAAELIVVGSRGRGPWRAAVLGSVSGELARSAGRPVLIVPAR
jgi:nucleotide-binding universal stress UspA family protein